MRSLYVFDLDGTLANTAELSGGRRTPRLLLSDDPLDTDLAVGPERWQLVNELGVDMSAAPGEVRAAGHASAVITRAPRAYASTLAGMLGLERTAIWPSTAASIPDKLRGLARLHRLPLARVVYVGDTDEDSAAARTAGCNFIEVGEFELPEEPELEDPSDVDDDSVAAIVTSLTTHPQHRRWEFQARLARLATSAHRYCLIPPRGATSLPDGVFMDAGVGATLFTRAERGENYLHLLRNLFPAQRTTRVRPNSGDSYYFCSYVKLGQEGAQGADPLGGLFRMMKNYRQTSGPEVELGSLTLVSDVFAGHLSAWFRFKAEGGFKVDHVAPNPFTTETPGRVSSWLARLIADRVGETLGTEWAPVASVQRSRNGLAPNPDFQGPPPWAVLIDDQRTVGNSLARHIDTSHIPEWEVTLTWSHSNPPTPTGPDPAFSRTTEGCYWPDEGPCPRHGPSAFQRATKPRAGRRLTASTPTANQVNTGAAKVIATLETYSQAWARWEPADDETLTRLVREGRSRGDIARIMARTPGAISARIKKLRDESV